MSPSLLTLSFHLPQSFGPQISNLREDARFKKYAFDSGLLTEETMGGDVPPELAEQATSGGRGTPASGLVSGTYRIDGADVRQISLLRVGGNAWVRPEYRSRPGQPSRFEEWIRPRIEAACHCLLLSGHHSSLDQDRPLLWGAEDIASPDHRYYTCFRPLGEGDAVAPSLEIKGHPLAQGGAVRRAGPFDCSTTLASCRLVVIIGCNGAEREKGGWWQRWVRSAAGVTPVVLGWHGVHEMPKDRLPDSFSQGFWRRLGQLAVDHQPRRTLAQLCELQHADVIRAWGASLKEAFTSPEQRHLWFYSREKCAGAIDPDGRQWRVRSANGDLERDP